MLRELSDTFQKMTSVFYIAFLVFLNVGTGLPQTTPSNQEIETSLDFENYSLDLFERSSFFLKRRLQARYTLRKCDKVEITPNS